ncbi:MAG: dual specificity protein phosphatase family protein [Thermoguttaceae bacterium]|jgi:hypothetical protein|nr:dual specificity protein phosphatase family protein [Thermoguttaceae bacterium]
MTDLDEILPNLFVGACPRSVDDIDWLNRKYGVTAVLNLQTEEDFDYWGIDWPCLAEGYRRRNMEVRRVPVRDFDRQHLRERLPECVRVLDSLIQAGHRVYVHCSAGINRSPSSVIAYLHWCRGLSFDEAVEHVLARRACDPYFEAVLEASRDRSGPLPGEGQDRPSGPQDKS